ncbi:MAG TPA: carboxypeptidase-like regulatory domain-containing protein, partial [Candidatus Eremiobacteraceae bacterium]|nr:carboxypeptidase-like regulatory domain-containing protein [Candidatus Eremiobacteraceae bacterium]
MMRIHRYWALALVMFAFLIAGGGSAYAGTTGGISGHVIDSASSAPIAGAQVAAVSPSQSETSTSDATGAYSFVSLSPDTYTLTGSKSGYDSTV